MELVNCPRCRRVFTKIKCPVCPNCEKEEEEIFQEVKAYLYENSGIGIVDLSEATGTSIKKIQSYIKDGRIQMSEGSFLLRCSMCGVDIVEGNYCNKCTIKVHNELIDAKNSMKNANSTIRDDANHGFHNKRI